MDAKNGYCSAQLKQAKNMARDHYFDASITAVGKGLERLLKELFDELRDKDKSNLIDLSVQYDKAKSKKRWKNSKDGEKELNLYGWIKFYQEDNIFWKLENTCDYEFDEFNGNNLHQIRLARNEYGAHDNEQYDIHREFSDSLIELYSKILSETGRIAQPTSIVPFNRLRRNNNNQLTLNSGEKSLLKQEFDDLLRNSPDEIDFLFLRAYLLRGENAALDDLQKILILNPDHNEARTERIWNLNRRHSEEPASQQSSPHLSQVNISFKTKIVQTFSTTRNFYPKVLSNNSISFKPKFSIFSLSISEKSARYITNAVVACFLFFVVAAVVVAAIAAVLGLAVLDVLKQSPPLVGIFVVVVLLLWFILRR